MTPEEREAVMAEIAEIEEEERQERVLMLRQRGADTMEGYGPMDQALIGMGGSVRQMQLGIQDLFSDLTAAEQEELEVLMGGLDKSGWATAGNVGGDIMQMAALPIGAIGGLLSKLGPSILAKATPILTDIVASAGFEAAKAPVEGKGRGDRFEDALIGGAVGTTAFKGLEKVGGKLWKGVKPSDAAEKLLQQAPDIRLTPGQKSGGDFTQEVEQTFAAMPFVSGAVTDLQTQGLKDLNVHWMNKVNPPGRMPIINSGKEGFDELQKNFTGAYDEVWSKVTRDNLDAARLDNALKRGIDDAAGDLGPELSIPTQKIFRDAREDLNRFIQTGETEYLDRANKMLRPATGADRSVRDIQNKVRDEFKEALPAEAGKDLKVIEKQYADYSVLQEASTYQDALLANNLVTPKNLVASTKKMSDSRDLSKGQGRMQEEAVNAAEVFGTGRPSQNKMAKYIGRGAAAVGGYVAPLSTAATLAGTRGLATEPARRLLTGGASELPKMTREMIPDQVQDLFSKAVDPMMAKIQQMGEAVSPVTEQMQLQRAMSNILRRDSKPVSQEISTTMEDINRLMGRSSAAYGARDESGYDY